jgi:hypothetical protein
MHTHPCRPLLPVIAFVLALSATAGSARQSAATLPIGKTESGQAGNNADAAYQFKAASAGVLTVAVVGEGDVEIAVTDEEGQPVLDGTSDRDLFGSTGTEELSVVLTEPGAYRVLVRSVDGNPNKFQIGASWLSMPAFAKTGDPDRRPSQARSLEVGKAHEDSIDTDSGDPWDWFVYTPAEAGTLTIILRPTSSNSFDLTLEAFTTNDFTRPTASSDQDLQGHAANESLSLDVPAGQKVLVKVYAGFGSASGKYRLSSSLIR